jgi:hypothetical protein
MAIGIHYEVVRPVGAATPDLAGDDGGLLGVKDLLMMGRATDVDVIPWAESPGVGGTGGG